MPIYSKLGTTLLVCGVLLAAGNAHADEPLVAILVHGPDSPVDFGDSIPLVVDIVNNLDRPITHAAYSLVPTANNDETRGITIQAVYRDQMIKGGIPVVAVPTVGIRHAIPVHTIEPGGRLRIRLDASKWQITDGWKPGQYKVSVRVTDLRVGPSTILTVTSTIFEFVIRQRATSG